MKWVIKTVYPTINQGKLYIQKSKKYLKEQGLIIENIANYAAVNELRCLNNSINILNNELAAYKGGEKIKELLDLRSAFVRL